MGINVPHTYVGWQFCFFTQDCSAFLYLMSDFVALFFRRPSLLVFFCGAKIVVAVVNVDFNWFQLRFFPPLVMSLWMGISLEFYAFVHFYLNLSQEDSNGICFMILIWNIFSNWFLFKLSWWSWRRLPFILFTFFARRHSSFGLFPGVYRPFFFSTLMRCA